MSRVQTTSSGNSPATNERRNGCSNRAKWMTVGAGCCERSAAWSDSSRQARVRRQRPAACARRSRDPGNGWRNLLASGKRDQARMRGRHCRAEDAGPADFKEMPSRRRGRGLALDHQDLQIRERLGTTA